MSKNSKTKKHLKYECCIEQIFSEKLNSFKSIWVLTEWNFFIKSKVVAIQFRGQKYNWNYTIIFFFINSFFIKHFFCCWTSALWLCWGNIASKMLWKNEFLSEINSRTISDTSHVFWFLNRQKLAGNKFVNWIKSGKKKSEMSSNVPQNWNTFVIWKF